MNVSLMDINIDSCLIFSPHCSTKLTREITFIVIRDEGSESDDHEVFSIFFVTFYNNSRIN